MNCNLYVLFSRISHEIATKDGHILQLFERKAPNERSLNNGPVLLIHGCMMNSDVWCIPYFEGPNWVELLADNKYALSLISS